MSVQPLKVFFGVAFSRVTRQEDNWKAGAVNYHSKISDTLPSLAEIPGLFLGKLQDENIGIHLSHCKHQLKNINNM